MAEYESFSEICLLWSSDAALARETGVKTNTAWRWRTENFIHDGNWEALIRAAHERGFDGVTYAVLNKIGVQRRKERRAAIGAKQ